MVIADTQLKVEDKTQPENIISGAMRITGVKVTYYFTAIQNSGCSHIT